MVFLRRGVKCGWGEVTLLLYPRLEQEGLRQKTDKMKLKPDLEANCNQSHQTGKGQDENGARTSTEGADEK